MKKIIALAVTLMLVAAVALSATMAYLTRVTEAKENIFTIGDINVELDEEEWVPDSKIVPGATIPKKPIITVKAGSEPSYIFAYLENTLAVQVGSAWDYAQPNIDPNNWASVAQSIDQATGVKKELYRYIGGTDGIVNATSDVPLTFFETVAVPGATFTKESMQVLDTKTKKMTIKAFAHQSDHVTLTAAESAAEAQFGFTTTTP